MEKDAPKKPLQPFFVFMQKERAKGNMIAGKTAGEQWNKLPDKERQVYVNEYKKEMAKFEKYLEEVEGIKPRKQSLKNQEKLSPMKNAGSRPDHFRSKRIRAVIGMDREIMPMATKQIYRGLGRVMVS
jgi:hypothetical protein